MPKKGTMDPKTTEKIVGLRNILEIIKCKGIGGNHTPIRHKIVKSNDEPLTRNMFHSIDKVR